MADMRKKIIPEVDIYTGEDVFPTVSLLDIVKMALKNMSVDWDYTPGSSSYSEYEPDDYDVLEMYVSFSITFARIHEVYRMTQKDWDMLEEAIANLSCYPEVGECIEEAVKEALPHWYSAYGMGIEATFNKKKEALSFEMDFDDYSVDYEEYALASRPDIDDD